MTQVEKKMKDRRKQILDIQEGLLKKAAESKIPLTETENTQFDNFTKELDKLSADIAKFDAVRQGKAEFGEVAFSGSSITGSGSGFHAMGSRKPLNVDEKYFEGFWKSLRSANQAQLFQIQNASLGEGGSPSGDGSYLVPVSTAAEILPLAAYECAARQVFKVVSTDKNIYLPVQSARSTAAIKPESNNSGQNSFTTTVPQFSNVLLSAFVLGNSVTVSTELFDDVPTLADFVSSEMQRAIQAQEEVYFTSGSGDGQPQGILDNVTTASGASITDGGAALSINAVLDTMGSLPKAYINRAVWLTNRIEAVRLLKAQLAADQYQQFISFDGPNGGMKLLGFDMFFSYEIPTYIASPSTSGEWIFGDLRSAATIGDRNGSAIKVRVLDQVGALQGQVTIVGQRRTDMRVTISEAAVQFSATS